LVPLNEKAVALTFANELGRQVRLAPLLPVFVPHPPDAMDPSSSRHVVSVAAIADGTTAMPMTPTTAALIRPFFMD
jgi:hypothetical protein